MREIALYGPPTRNAKRQITIEQMLYKSSIKADENPKIPSYDNISQ